MSRVGKMPIQIKEDVKVSISGDMVQVDGPKGSLKFVKDKKIEVKVVDENVIVSVKKESQNSEALWGLTRTLINNMVIGVNQGFEKKLEFKGTGYRAKVEEGKIVLNMGYNRPVEMVIPEDIEIKIQKNTITIIGIDKQEIGQFAAEIRNVRKPEPYKGKGIRYSDEVIKRKAGKAATK